jgi:hypothetical protein
MNNEQMAQQVNHTHATRATNDKSFWVVSLLKEFIRHFDCFPFFANKNALQKPKATKKYCLC